MTFSSKESKAKSCAITPISSFIAVQLSNTTTLGPISSWRGAAVLSRVDCGRSQLLAVVDSMKDEEDTMTKAALFQQECAPLLVRSKRTKSAAEESDLPGTSQSRARLQPGL